MRLFFGMLLGAALTVGLAYLHDARVPTQDAGIGNEFQARTLVNWGVANARWKEFKTDAVGLGEDARRGFDRLAGKL